MEGIPTTKHVACQMTRQELMSPDCGSLKVGDPCPGCRTLDGRFAPVCVHPSAPVAPVGNKINSIPLFKTVINIAT